MLTGVGMDVMSAADITASLDRFGDRYAERVFTAGELRRAGRGTGRDLALARCFAAKEAVLKALRLPDSAVAWTQIDIAEPAVSFSGPLAEQLAGAEAPITHVATAAQEGMAVGFALVERRNT